MTWTLTEKEMFIAQLVADGLQNAEIAVLTGNTEHMTKNKIRTIFDKLGMWNRTELAMWYVKHEHDNAQKGGV